MTLAELAAARRTHKEFGREPVERETLLELLDVARLAPNHHLTQPWRFRVLGHAPAQLQLGAGMVMLGEAGEGATARTPDDPAASTTIYVVVADPDAHCARARQAGAEIDREPVDQDYGGRDYTARDLDGHLWSFGTYDPYAPGG